MKRPHSCLVSTVIVLAALTAPGLAEDRPAKRLIERGDRFYARREKGPKWVEKASQCFEKALAVESKNVEASWRYSRAIFWLGSRAETDEEKLRLLGRAIDVAKRAIAIDAQSVESHYWLGVSFAKYGEVKGVMDALGLIEPIRKQMRRVIELDEGFAGGGGYRILGWISYKLPGIAGGSEKKAIELLEKAVEQDPTHLLNHLCLAEIHRENDRPDLARGHLDIIIKASLTEDRKPEEMETKVAAKEMLAKLSR